MAVFDTKMWIFVAFLLLVIKQKADKSGCFCKLSVTGLQRGTQGPTGPMGFKYIFQNITSHETLIAISW